jgi:hypothetical protein
MLIATLTACGESTKETAVFGEESTSALTDSETQTSSIITQNDEISSDGLATIGLLSREGDEQYFTPKSDDYIYQIISNGEYSDSGPIYQDAYLLSFNEKGELVQCVFKETNEMWTDEEMDEWHREQGAVKVGDTFYTDQLEIFEEDSDYGFWSAKFGAIGKMKSDSVCVGSSATNQYNEYYISKPLTSEQTEIANRYSLADFPEIAASGAVMITDDYVISKEVDKCEYEEYVGLHYIGEGPDRIIFPVRVYKYFAYYNTAITFYNEDGTVTDAYEIKAFDSADMIVEYFRYCYGYELEDSASLDPNDLSIRETVLSEDGKAAMNDTDNYTIRDNYLIVKLPAEDYEAERKLTPDFFATDRWKTYYSKPYLTDKQIENDKYLLTGAYY